KSRKSQLCLRDPAGRLLISSDEIESYEWATHTIVLRAGVGEKLRKSRLGPKPRLTHPFVAALGTEPVYEGEIVSALSSRSVDKVCIVLDLEPRRFDRLKIDLGYASAKIFAVDHRKDDRIKKSLGAAEKLK